MRKFKVLKNNQTYMSILGMYSDRLNEPTNELFSSFFCYYVFFFMTLLIISSTLYIVKYPSDIKHALGAFKMCFAAIQCLGMFFGIGLKMIKVKALHLELQRIVDEGMPILLVFALFLSIFIRIMVLSRSFGTFNSDFFVQTV